jgi:hypothetical protein
MSDFIVDESRFFLDDDQYDSSFIPAGFTLPDGIVFGEKTDDAQSWQRYSSADRRFDLLVVLPELAEKWAEQKLLPQEALLPISVNGKDYYVLISPSQLRLKRASQIRFKGSRRYALQFLSALMHTRQIDTDTSLRDAIYVELYGVMLPCYGLVPPVSDRALFRNALRGRNDPEDLSSPGDENGGVSFEYARTELEGRGFAKTSEKPFFVSGETADFPGRRSLLVTGPLCLAPQYQIFDTASSKYLLVLEKLWAEALMSTPLLSSMSLDPMVLDGRQVYVLTLSKRFALEPLNDRHYGNDRHSFIELAQAVRRTRAAAPQSRLGDALYVQEIGALLPVSFKDGGKSGRETMAEVLSEGPFAQGPLLDDMSRDAELIAGSCD